MLELVLKNENASLSPGAHTFRLVQKMPGEQRRKIYNQCLTFLDALAPSAALALRSVGASLLELAVLCVIWI